MSKTTADYPFVEGDRIMFNSTDSLDRQDRSNAVWEILSVGVDTWFVRNPYTGQETVAYPDAPHGTWVKAPVTHDCVCVTTTYKQVTLVLHPDGSVTWEDREPVWESPDEGNCV